MNDNSDSADIADTSSRELLHTRRIEMNGYRRSDGLYEVEGRLIDTKPHDFIPRSGGEPVAGGRAIHDISLCLVYDSAMIVRAARSETRAAPYRDCPAAGLAIQALVGLSMNKGWNTAARKALAPAERCTHMVELLGPLATTAFQSLSAPRASLPEPVDEHGRPLKIGSCYAYGASRELVQRHWPEFHEKHEAAAAGTPDA